MPSEESENENSVSLSSFQKSLSKFTYAASTSSLSKRPTSALQIQPTRNLKRKREGGDSHSEPREKKASKPKPRRPPRGYAPPEQYAHLHLLNDCLSENLDVVFCGINPGQTSAATGHHFAHPSNHFWKCLHLSGLTSVRIPPDEDYTLPERFRLGITNMVDRPTIEANELKDSELKSGIPGFMQKMTRYRPRILAFVGLHTARLVYNYAQKQKGALVLVEHMEFKPGLQNYKIVHEGSGETLFYALPCTSGRVRGYQIPDKVVLFAQLKRDLDGLKGGIRKVAEEES